MIGSDSFSRQVFIYLDPILIYIGQDVGSDCISSWSLLIFLLWIDCLFEICKIMVCFLWLSFPGDYRVIDEALLAETT